MKNKGIILFIVLFCPGIGFMTQAQYPKITEEFRKPVMNICKRLPPVGDCLAKSPAHHREEARGADLTSLGCPPTDLPQQRSLHFRVLKEEGCTPSEGAVVKSCGYESRRLGPALSVTPARPAVQRIMSSRGRHHPLQSPLIIRAPYLTIAVRPHPERRLHCGNRSGSTRTM